MLCPLSVPHCSKTKYSILFIWPLLLKMPGVDQIGTNYLLKNYYRGSFPHFVWTLLGYCFLCRWFTKFTHDTFFSGNFSHEREFRDEVFVIAVNCTQSLSIPLVKKINKLRTIGESYPLSLFMQASSHIFNRLFSEWRNWKGFSIFLQVRLALNWWHIRAPRNPHRKWSHYTFPLWFQTERLLSSVSWLIFGAWKSG